MRVSPFTPLFFLGDHKTDGLECEYIQTFAPTDSILLEILADSLDSRPLVDIISEPSGARLYRATMRRWEMNEDTTLYFMPLSFAPGYYSVEIDGLGKSEPFRVTDDPQELKGTTLIQYSMKNNRQRKDAVFFIDHIQYFFDFRVHGGFKDSGWTFGVENEQFTTQFADIAQLYGLESTQKTFTLGNGAGVPVWFGEMLNRILVCSHVYFDGEKYTRKETNVPEKTQQLEGTNSFVFTQVLQKSVNLDPVIEERNSIIMRRVDNSHYRIVKENIYRKI